MCARAHTHAPLCLKALCLYTYAHIMS